ncbi:MULTISPECIES: alpha-ketoacid dehydrogenase subunit beta [unclassified Novosphingobium]|uniref:alpha-ketoacid dehydrogenase subunit beta n=1 Tax=Novosphingobium TaxID=165696 RepID=UPI00144817A1|nr:MULTISPECIES: alpha-ketoacid dehydrogenase subunit beta [unclassified Novosphingobium]NKJ44273.1 pyruvate dehydrogenase E1 component beta subunit [Novosphingobium sp. SG720]NMN05271.1 pyruvate dehydrogenase E1 component beta subunit [Novosphingobium sp. SG919]NMN87566.1 pyruvate dehydrogenase E1 component beta subunit [Novosphingobium sp. SG916]
MTKMMYRDAVLSTIMEEMARDPDVVVLGEDVVGGMGTAGGPEAIGGIWSTSTGLYDRFGPTRVIDTPISESAIIGAAAGLALSGKRPVAELMFADFIGVCLDQLWNQIAKFRYMFGGKTRCPAVIRMAYGAGFNAAAQHSQSVHQILTGMPGLKVVMPATPADVKGLLRTAIRDDDPVIFLEHKALYATSGEVPDDPDFMIPFGHARLTRAGGDVTIVSTGLLLGMCEAAADRLAAEGIGCDVIDLRTTSPLDEEAILDSVEVTGRLIVVDEAPPRCGLAADLRALVAEKAFSSLKAPPLQVTPPHTPIPFARELESAYLPSIDKIEDAVRRVLAWR